MGTMLVPLSVEQGLDSSIFDNGSLTYWRAEGEMHVRLQRILGAANVGYVAQTLRISDFLCALLLPFAFCLLSLAVPPL